MVLQNPWDFVEFQFNIPAVTSSYFLRYVRLAVLMTRKCQSRKCQDCLEVLSVLFGFTNDI